jgi:peptidyl-prolyl cis-trans isomerase A (cyclophilin A)
MLKKNINWILFIFCLLLIPMACSTSDTETPAEPEASAEAAQAEMKAADDTKTAESIAAEPEPEPEPAAKAEAPKADPPDERKIVEKAPPKKNLLLEPTTKYDQAPAEFKIQFETTKGNFTVRMVRDWSPRGVDHLHHLVSSGYYTDIAFFRAIEGFMVQFGMHGDPKINGLWADTNIQDEPVKVSNKRGYMSFAKSNAPNSRSTQLFINLVDNSNLDGYGFSPIGEVIEGMSVVDSIYMGYGEGAPRGRGPSQGLINQQGNAYLKSQFPNLDYIKTAKIMD